MAKEETMGTKKSHNRTWDKMDRGRGGSWAFNRPREGQVLHKILLIR